MRIVIANRGLEFDGESPGRRPLGGVESATIALAEALARRGHEVAVHASPAQPTTIRGVAWRRLADGLPLRADLYIANRDHELLLGLPFARRRVLWLHNPANELGTAHRVKMALLPPAVVVLGAYHRSTCPPWLARQRIVTIPLAVADTFRHRAPAEAAPPPPVAIFTSNPARNLEWLLGIWAERIQPRLRQAELHIYSGPEVYQMTGGTGFETMRRILARADALADRGVVRHVPVGRAELARRVVAARAMLYRGHEQETFCLALAEAQALGLPCVVQPFGSAPERVRDGVTGHVAPDDDAFVEHALAVLGDDAHWLRLHRAACEAQPSRGWDDVAQDFEALLPR
ncbi:MAG TPA: glycosyltransferase [Falsiroseomonas sp.]|nr:glycosyltransferase [Falsiroseomonas sp.]